MTLKCIDWRFVKEGAAETAVNDDGIDDRRFVHVLQVLKTADG